MVDESDYEFSDNEIDETRHDKLVENVLSLNKIQNLKKPVRTEPTQEVSEFNLIKSASNKQGLIQPNELTKAIEKFKTKGISKKLKYTYVKGKTLPTPLEKPQAEQIRRSVNYERSRLQLDRWEAFVTSNRAATNVVFPLDSVEKIKIEEKKAEVYPSTWRIKSDLQKKLEEIEKGKEQSQPSNEDEGATFALTYEELRERRQQAAKLRIHQSYKEAKARKQNKIKSKKYHRILKREKIKQKLKEFEELQKTDPEEAVKKLEEIDKARAEERFSLRHKGTGQWARNKQIRAKYDKESRQVLAQQLMLSRELTQKLKSADSDSEDDASKNKPVNSQVGKDNVWMNDIKAGKEVSDFVSNYRQYWNEQNKKLSEQENKGTNNDDEVEEEREQEIKKANSNDKINKKLKSSKKTKKSVALKQNVDSTVEEPVNEGQNLKKKKPNKKENKTKGVKRKFEELTSTSDWQVTELKPIDLKDGDIEDIFDKLENNINKKAKQKYKKIKKKSKQLQKPKIAPTNNTDSTDASDLTMPLKRMKQVIDEEMIEDSGKDENNVNTATKELNNLINIVNSESAKPADINPENFPKVQQTLNTAIPNFMSTDENEEETIDNILEEAFNDDDIIKDFQQEKKDTVDQDKPQDINLELPGWGQWGGGNIPLHRRKHKRFMIKAPPEMPRKDQNKGFLIINEKAQSKIKPLMVSELPFPFKTVHDYEASIRAPIGRTFVPETAFKKFIEPAIVTKMGSIIEPVNKSMLMGQKKSF